MKSFVDDNMELQEDRTYYRNFENVTKLADETFAEEFNESMHEIKILMRFQISAKVLKKKVK